MILRLCPDQIKTHWNLINRTIELAFPTTAMKNKVTLLRDLLLENAQCWFHMTEDDINAVFITRINVDHIADQSIFTVLAAYGVRPLTKDIIYEAFEAGAKFARAHNCSFIDLYSNNEKILNLIHDLDVLWESQYVQIRL